MEWQIVDMNGRQYCRITTTLTPYIYGGFSCEGESTLELAAIPLTPGSPGSAFEAQDLAQPVDIIDQIDELVNDQLANYGNRSGYDHNVSQEKCWRCHREWHGLAITERIAGMYAARTYDENYSYAADDTRIVCPGSDFIGPMPAAAQPAGPRWNDSPRDWSCVIGEPDRPSLAPNWLREMIGTTERWAREVGLRLTQGSPYMVDFDMPQEGELISVQMRDGTLLTERVSAIDRDRATGAVTVTVGQSGDDE